MKLKTPADVEAYRRALVDWYLKHRTKLLTDFPQERIVKMALREATPWPAPVGAALLAIIEHESKFTAVGPAGYSPFREWPAASTATDLGVGQMTRATFDYFKTLPTYANMGCKAEWVHSDLAFPDIAIPVTLAFVMHLWQKYEDMPDPAAEALYRYAGTHSAPNAASYMTKPTGLGPLFRKYLEKLTRFHQTGTKIPVNKEF